MDLLTLSLAPPPPRPVQERERRLPLIGWNHSESGQRAEREET